MLSVFRPSFEVVKEGRIFLAEKMSWKYSSPLQATHLINIDGAEISLLFANHYIIKQ
jgi:hypothetical protein